MKKLLTMLVTATAIAFGVKTAAADPISSVNFDTLTADTDYNAMFADDQSDQTSGPYYWVDATLARFLATNIIGQVKAHTGVVPASNEIFEDTNSKYLELDTDAVVYRRAKGDGAGTTMGQIYVDALVQFTPSDEDAACAINEGDKIAIWMREANIDSNDPENPPATNLLVHAGGTSGATDYVIAGDWKAGQWYRLVIKSGTTIANNNPGFVIFIDGQKIKDVNDVEVFPSLDTGTEDYQTIKAIGFNGTGAIDQIAFTTDDPCPEVKPFTINWDSHVATLSIEYPDGNGGTIVSNLTNVAGGTETVLLPPTGGTVGVTYTLDSTFAFDADASTASNCSYANGVVTVGANAIEPSFSIVTYSQNFFVGGNSFASFEDALDALPQGGGTIALGKDVVVPYAAGDQMPGSIYVEEGTVIIDLAGHTITGSYDSDADYTATIINNGADLIITNSTVQVGSVIGACIGEYDEDPEDEVLPVPVYGDSLCILAGDTEIYGGKFENKVDVDPEGEDNFNLAICGGSYKDNGTSASFGLATYVASGLEATYAAPYWTVGAPAEYAITLPAAPANSSWSVTVNDSPVSGVNNVYTAGEGDTLVATLTADAGYIFSDGTTSKVYEFEDIDSDINAAADPGFVLPTVTTPKAKIGTTIYLTLTDALNDAAAGDTVELLDDVVVDSTVAISQNLVLDLGGHSLSNTTVRSGETVARTLQANAGNVVVTNGTVYGRVNCYDSSTLTVAANTTVEGFVLVWGDGTYGEQGCLTPTFNLYGTINNAGEDNAIKTGTPDGSKPVINIYDGAVINYDGAYTAVVLNDGATLTMQGGTLNAGSAGAGIGLWEGASFTMTGGDITTGSFGVFNNGMVQDATTMSISGGTVTSTNGDACAVYQAGPGALTLSGTAVVSGPDAVEVRAGTVQVLDNAQLIATAPYSAPQSNGGGNSGHGGVALIVSQHTTAQNVSATVSGGTLTGEVAFVEATLESQNDPTKVGGSITGGTLYGDIETEDIAGFISGGTFDQPLDPELCAEGYVPADNGGGSYGVDYGYTITYVSAYGDAPAAKNVTVATLNAAYTLVAADLPEMVVAGQVFNGWGKAVGDTISADTTLTAQWASANYTITLPAAAANTSWYVEANGVEVVPAAGVYTVAAGADVVVYSKADAGYLFENGSDTKTVYTFEDIAASQDKSADAAPAPAAAKAKIGTTLYLSLQDAINAVPAAGADYTTITVIGDQTLPSGTKAIVTNKKVDFEAESAVVVTGQLRVVDGADVIIGQNVTFTSTSHPTVFILGDPAVGTAGSNGASSLVVNGVVANTNPSFDATFAIAGNGTDTLGADITVNGTVTNANGIAIYQAFPGDLVVNGTVVGASAISIKDGSLTVNDGAVVAATLADGQAYVGNNNGESPTGDAIIAPYYPSANGYGTPVLDIEGGTITVADTANCSGIEAYDFNGVTAPDDSKSNVNVSGGTFNTPIADDYCANGYVPADDGAGNYGVTYGYTITYVSAYGTAPAEKTVTVATLGGAYTLVAADLPALEAEGYTFNGWGKTAGETISADTVLTASWTEAPVAVVLNLSGSGTAVDPYLITNLADLKNFRDWVNDRNTGAGLYFKVTAATIDLASESPWTPIGSKEDSKYFAGEFDGNGVVINNLSLAASPDYGGFFSAVDGAVLKSFTLGASTITGLANGAAVCAYTKASGGAMFSNVVNNVSITGSKKLGGFVCQANGENTFIDCVNNGAIACTALTDGKIAGGFIAMYNHGDGVKATFLRCVNNGTIGTGGQCAGFIAYNQTTLATGGNDFTSCTNNGAITAQITAGGFSAKGGNSNTMNGDYTFTNCAQLGTLTSVANAANSYNIESSISGAQGTHNAYGKTTILSAYGIVNHNGIQAKKGWLWKAKIVGETYTTLYSDLATAVADADGETLVIAADSTLSNSFDIDGTVTIGAGIAVSGGNLRVNSGTLAITNGTFTGVSLATSGTGAITITGGTFDADPSAFVAEGYEAVEEGGLYTVQPEAQPAGKWDDVEANSIAGMTAENKEAVEATLDKLETALGSVADVETWISTVYGSADIPAAKLVATTDALIAISLAYDLPILEGEPEVTVETTTTTTGKAAFLFTFTDDDDPVSVQAEKALQLIKYSATVNGEFVYTPAKFVVTAVESANGNVLKAEFVGADAAGYGKVDFTVPQN